MLKSMTGYGRGSNEYFVIEIQAVNHKFCEIKISAPFFMIFLENKIKEYVREKIARGKLLILINAKDPINAFFNKFQIDKELAKAYKESLCELGKFLRLKNDLKLSHIIGINGIINRNNIVVEERDKLWEWLKKSLDIAIDELIYTRMIEGGKIESEFKIQLKNLKELVGEIETILPQVIVEYREKLQNRLDNLGINRELFDEARIYQEIAIFVDKSDISEELLRVRSHIQQFEEILTLNKPVGRQLEFLTQELYREINTIGAKTGNIKIIQLALQAKNELEKIREQIQNVE